MAPFAVLNFRTSSGGINISPFARIPTRFDAARAVQKTCAEEIGVSKMGLRTVCMAK